MIQPSITAAAEVLVDPALHRSHRQRSHRQRPKSFPTTSPAAGLTNLQRRAEEVGGSVTVQDTPERGTRLRWSAPLP